MGACPPLPASTPTSPSPSLSPSPSSCPGSIRLRLRLSVGCDADHASLGSAPVPFAGIWEAMEKLNTLVDESDPDVSIPHPDKHGRPRPHPSDLQSDIRALFPSPPAPVSATSIYNRPSSPRSSTSSRPRRPSVAMGSPSGCRSPASCTTSASSSTSSALSTCHLYLTANPRGASLTVLPWLQGPVGRRRGKSRHG